MTDKKEKDQNKDKQRLQDAQLWQHVTKDVSPIKKEHASVNIIKQKHEKKGSPSPQSVCQSEQRQPYSKTISKTQETDFSSRQIDTRTEQRLKRGQFKIELKIDLHGKSQIQAYDTLQALIPNAFHQGKRCILVITGKGAHKTDMSLLEQTTGILKQKTPEWLSSTPLNQYVLRYETARPKDGGQGALYVLLRRSK